MNDPKQHTLWLLAAIAAPIAHFSGSGWLTASLTAAAILPLTLIPRNWSFPKSVAVLEILWLGTVAGLMLPGSAAYWPSGNTAIVPMVILFLAAITDPCAAPRIGAVLALCMALLGIPILVSAASRIEPDWLAPIVKPWSAGQALSLLLAALPAAGQGRQGKRLAGMAVLSILLSALVQGVTGSINVDAPFYQTARTLGHMEPVAAAAMTLGWYAMAAFLLQSAKEISGESGISQKWASVLVLGTSTLLVFFSQQPNAWFVTGITLFLWVIAPFLTKIKNFEKSEK